MFTLVEAKASFENAPLKNCPTLKQALLQPAEEVRRNAEQPLPPIQMGRTLGNRSHSRVRSRHHGGGSPHNNRTSLPAQK
jgi:hypothetical protein